MKAGSQNYLRSLPARFEGSTAAVLVLLVIACTLYIHQAPVRSVWGDEAYSIIAASAESIYGVMVNVSYDVHPPLYFFILHYWMKWFGITEAALRSLSIVFGIFALIVLYTAGRRFHSGPAGLWCLVLLCLSPFIIFHSVDARMYSQLLCLEALCILAGGLFLEKSGIKYWCIFTGAALASLYTHYLALIFLACLLISGIILSRNDLKKILAWPASGAVCAVCFAFWLPRLPGQLRMMAEPSPDHMHRFRLQDLHDLVDTLNPFVHSSSQALDLVGELAVAVLVTVGFIALLRRRTKAAQWLILGLVLTGCTFIVAGLVRPIVNPRNFLIITPFIAVFAGAGISRMPLAIRWPVSLAILVCWLFLLPGLDNYQKTDDWRKAVTYLGDNFRPNDKVMLSDNFGNYKLNIVKYYLVRTGVMEKTVKGKNFFMTGETDGIPFDPFSPVKSRWFLIENEENPDIKTRERFEKHGLTVIKSITEPGIIITWYELKNT